MNTCTNIQVICIIICECEKKSTVNYLQNHLIVRCVDKKANKAYINK